MTSLLAVAHDTIKNSLAAPDILYITEPSDWVIRQLGKDLARTIGGSGLTFRLSTTPRGSRARLIHFGSLNTLTAVSAFPQQKRQKHTLATVFHLVPGDPRLSAVVAALRTVSRVHTASQAARAALQEAGVPAERIIVIPLGVDTNIFTPASSELRRAVRRRLGIPLDAFVIGSFQKDGVGWGRGLEPKLIKGPDVFAHAAQLAAQNRSVHVLLAGPARGYIERELQKRGVPLTSVGFRPSLADIAPLYHALDCYLITSRIEGGPKQLLEAWASGVPVVSTKVGLVPDSARHGENALLADVEDTPALASALRLLMTNPRASRRLVAKALHAVQPYRWSVIAGRYLNELYHPLLARAADHADLPLV
jgi:glycosyltransferase involved in cell wall biosynthesis